MIRTAVIVTWRALRWDIYTRDAIELRGQDSDIYSMTWTEDFKSYGAWAQSVGYSDKELKQYREWIAALEAGRSPFDDKTLANLSSY
jgi:hypothetical protein